MHEAMERSKKLHSLKEKLISMLECNRYDIDSNEGGQVVDMIKDLAEAEEKCWKACYYKKIIEAMEEGEEISKRLNGRNNHRMGYHPDTYEPDMLERRLLDRTYDTREDQWDRKDTNAYDDFKNARKHYTETSSMTDKEKMDQKAKETAMMFTDVMRDMWKTSDPAIKKELKATVQKMLTEMN